MRELSPQTSIVFHRRMHNIFFSNLLFCIKEPLTRLNSIIDLLQMMKQTLDKTKKPRLKDKSRICSVQLKIEYRWAPAIIGPIVLIIFRNHKIQWNTRGHI